MLHLPFSDLPLKKCPMPLVLVMFFSLTEAPLPDPTPTPPNTPKWTRNGPKTDPKRTQTDPKRSRNGAKRTQNGRNQALWGGTPGGGLSGWGGVGIVRGKRKSLPSCTIPPQGNGTVSCPLNPCKPRLEKERGLLQDALTREVAGQKYATDPNLPHTRRPMTMPMGERGSSPADLPHFNC